MTTDPFTEAASAEAFYIYGASTGPSRTAFAAGAAWASDREPTSTEVEAAAQALHAEMLPHAAPNKWGQFPEEWKQSYRENARAALSAARAARRDEEDKP